MFRANLSDGSITPLVGRSGWSWPERPTLSRDGSLLAYLRRTPSLSHGALGSPLAEQLVFARPEDGSTLRTVSLGKVYGPNEPGDNTDLLSGGLVLSPDERSAIASCPAAMPANQPGSSAWTLCRMDVRTGAVKLLGNDSDLVPLAWPNAPIVPAGPNNRPLNLSGALHVALTRTGTNATVTVRAAAVLRGRLR